MTRQITAIAATVALLIGSAAVAAQSTQGTGRGGASGTTTRYGVPPPSRDTPTPA